MPLPPAFLDDLRARVGLSDYIGKRMKLTRAGREFKGCCPFHQEKTPSFTVNDEKQFYHCFGCGAHGDVISFAMRHDRLSFPEAIESLAAQAGLKVPQDTPAQREVYNKQKRLYELLEQATLFFEAQLRQTAGREGLAYFKGRGFSEDTISRFRLGFAPNDAQAIIRYLEGQGYSLSEMLDVGLIKKASDRPEHFSFFRGRVIFPVADKRGRTVAFGARILGAGEPKYLNSPDHPLFHKGKLLYGLSRAHAALNQGQPFVVVEGYTDVIALAQAGYLGALAPLGTALTEDQLQLLWRLLPPLDLRDAEKDDSPILCFDGDTAGLRAAARAVERALPLLTPAQTVRVAYLPAGEDPDSLLRQSGRGAFQALLQQAKPMIDVIWDLTFSGRRLDTPEQRAAASRAVRQKISLIRDESLKSFYKTEIENRLSVFFGRTQGPAEVRQPSGRLSRPMPAPPRRKPPNALILREKVLLALLLNHPELYEEFEEDILKIGFRSPPLEALRQEIVSIFSTDSHESLDVEAVYRHLSLGDAAKGLQKTMAEILSHATFVHAGFARPDRPLEQARQGWKSIWNKYLQEQLQADLQAAQALWHEDPSDVNYTRLMALRQQMESLVNESTEQELASGDEFVFRED